MSFHLLPTTLAGSNYSVNQGLVLENKMYYDKFEQYMFP